MTLDVVKNSLVVDGYAYTTAEGARNAFARLVVVAPLASEFLAEPSASSSPISAS